MPKITKLCLKLLE